MWILFRFFSSFLISYFIRTEPRVKSYKRNKGTLPRWIHWKKIEERKYIVSKKNKKNCNMCNFLVPVSPRWGTACKRSVDRDKLHDQLKVTIMALRLISCRVSAVSCKVRITLAILSFMAGKEVRIFLCYVEFILHLREWRMFFCAFVHFNLLWNYTVSEE